MHFSEIGLTLALALYVLSLWSSRTASNRALKLGTALLVIGFIAIRLILVGYSWQLLPVSIVSALALLSLAMLSTQKAWLRRTISLSLVIGLVISVAPLAFFPIATFPKPTGGFAVGTSTLHLVDTSRVEQYGRNAGKPREFMVQLWYPTDTADGFPKADYLPNATESAPAIATRLELPSFILNHTRLLKVNSAVGAPLASANAQYPLVIFSHGYQSLRGQTTPLMEELASHGYIVASMEHTYGAAVTIFPDGRIEFLDPNTLTGEGAAYDASARALGSQWQGDIRYFLSQLREGNIPVEDKQRFEGKIDFDNLAMFGHSTGAGVAMKTCQVVACKAVLGLDAWFGPVPDENLETGSSSPALFLMSELWPKPKNVSRIAQFMENSAEATWLTILGTGHYDFSDLPFLSPLTYQLGLSGPIDSARGQQIVAQTTLSFFNQYLMADSSATRNYTNLNYGEVVEKNLTELRNQ